MTKLHLLNFRLHSTLSSLTLLSVATVRRRCEGVILQPYLFVVKEEEEEYETWRSLGRGERVISKLKTGKERGGAADDRPLLAQEQQHAHCRPALFLRAVLYGKSIQNTGSL